MNSQFHNQLTSGARRILWWIPPGEWRLDGEQELAGLLPGSFDPLHDGHLGLCQQGAKQLGGVVAGELSIVNAEKPALTAAQVEQRCRQFADHPVAVTSASTFVEKSRLFPGVTFVVGADTAARVIDPQFYNEDAELMDAALEEIRRHSCSFLVAARQCQQQLLCLGRLEIPRRHQRLFQEIPASDFRRDLSSTQIRSQT